MNLPITGGCLCGTIRYAINAEPVGAGNCHCRTCQKASGAPYLSILFVPYEGLEIIGIYKEFETLSDSGNTVYRGFCAECGTMLFARNSGNDKVRPVSAVTLDNPGIYKPNMDFWVSDAQAWDIMDSNIPKFDANP